MCARQSYSYFNRDSKTDAIEAPAQVGIDYAYGQIYIYIHTVEPGYNDIGLYDTSSIASDILWYQLIPHSLTITLNFSVITTIIYNDTKYSVPSWRYNRVRLYIYIYIYIHTHTHTRGTWPAATWHPRCLCYRPAVFFRHLRLFVLSSRKEKYGACFKNVISFFYWF
jgi:hypothetical protein